MCGWPAVACRSGFWELCGRKNVSEPKKKIVLHFSVQLSLDSYLDISCYNGGYLYYKSFKWHKEVQIWKYKLCLWARSYIIGSVCLHTVWYERRSPTESQKGLASELHLGMSPKKCASANITEGSFVLRDKCKLCHHMHPIALQFTIPHYR